MASANFLLEVGPSLDLTADSERQVGGVGPDLGLVLGDPRSIPFLIAKQRSDPDDRLPDQAHDA
jgi:hypothetical protein